MSTAIKITVDDGGLPARNRQQVAANRQALVQKIAREQSTALGIDQRSQERIAQGRDPTTGALLIPPASTGALGAFGGGIPRLNQQPAANRNVTGGEEEFFLLRPTAGLVNGEIPLTSNKLPKALFTGSAVTFSASDGPSGSPALQAIPFEFDEPNYASLTNVLPLTPVSKYANRKLNDYTLQLFVRLGETYVAAQREVDFTLVLQGLSVVNSLGYSFGINMFAGLLPALRGITEYPASQFAFSESSNFAGTTSIYEGNAVDLASGDPKVAPGIWNHLAISKKGTTLHAFLNGQLLATAVSTLPSNSFLRPTTGFFTELSFGQTQSHIRPGQTVSIHGLRFDTKCLYTANFTPPPNL